MGLTIEVLCDKNATALKLEKIDASTDKCQTKIIYSSQYGCPVFTATAWVIYVSNHPWIMAIVLIVLGYFTAFKGRKFFNLLVAVIGGFLAFVASMMMFSAFGMLNYLDPIYEGDSSAGMAALAFILAIAVAGIVGALLFHFAF